MTAKRNHHTVPKAAERAKKALPPLALVMAGVLLTTLAVVPVRADITNSATANGTYNAAPVISDPDVASVPVTASAPALIVTKIADDTTNVTAGQVITYTYTVLNSGNAVITAVSLADAHNGAGPNPSPNGELLSNDSGTPGDSTDATPNDGTWDMLAPGDTITFTSTYTVQQTDVDTLQ
jgi:large repetitive protein